MSDHHAGSPPEDEGPAGGSEGHPAAADDFSVETELIDLRTVIELLERVGARMGEGGDRPGDAAAAPEVTGTLGDFSIVRVIGRGGMGIVYEAVQRSLNRRVALKVLPAAFAGDPHKLKRFLVEARAAACLRHPHIVPVHVVGSEDGQHYFAMQLIEGRTLAQVIARARRGREAGGGCADPTIGTLTAPRTAAELGRQAALALHFAHEQGIIHRDVKPSNLLVEDSGWLWVGDFGLARIAGQADLTVSGAVVGTLRYMSPEQALGERVGVDQRADIYSLGATLYELITLRPVREGDDRLELLRRIAEAEPTAPRRIDPAIPRDLDTIVRKAIATDPGDRYSTALELADDLGRFLEDRPIRARPPGLVDRAARWARRHRPAMAALACALLLAVVGLFGAGLWKNGVLRRHNSELKSALERAEAGETAARRLWYASQLRLGQQAWASGRVELAQDILDGLRSEPGGPEPSGFEWHYLCRICRHDVSVFSTREGLAVATAVAVRKGTMVTGHMDGTVVFWDLAAGREHARIRADDGSVQHLAFSPTGRALVSASKSDLKAPFQVTLWDARTARPLGRLPQARVAQHFKAAFTPDDRVLMVLDAAWPGDVARDRVVFWNLDSGGAPAVLGAAPVACTRMGCSPDGRWLATSAATGAVTLRDTMTGDVIAGPEESFVDIWELAVSPDGRTLAVAELGRVTIWDVRARRVLGCLPIRCPHIRFQFSPDGDRLAAIAEIGDNISLIADVRSSPRLVSMEGSVGKGLCFAFSPDGKALAVGGIGRPLALWDTSTGRRLAGFPGETGHVGCLAFTPGGESLIISSGIRPLRAWHLSRKPEPPDRLAGHKAEVWGLAYSRDGSTLISSSDDHLIKLWDARDGRLRSTLKGHGALAASVAVSADGSLLASAGFDRKVRLWELPGGGEIAVLGGHTEPVRAVVISPDRRLVASAGSDRTVRLWDVDRREPVQVLDGHTDVVRALAFDRTGDRLVSAGNDRTIRVIELRRGGRTLSLPCPDQVAAVAFSPDGTLLASADDAGYLTIRDAATWSKRRSVKVCDEGIPGLAFSPDGQTLAVGCGDARVRLYDPTTGQLMLELEGHGRRVNAVTFSPDGSTLASASHDGSIRLWHAGDH